MVKNVLIDLDDTLFDFKKAERESLKDTLKKYYVEPREEYLSLYSDINRSFWERLERGELTRDQVTVGRFGMLSEMIGIPFDAEGACDFYEHGLSTKAFLLDGALDFLSAARERYDLYIISNGSSDVQYPRIEKSGIGGYFRKIFISEEIGYEKPSAAFFEACAGMIPGYSADESVVIGDSLTSDIKGGLNAGIRTIWISGGRAPAGDVMPDHMTGDISGCLDILEKL